MSSDPPNPKNDLASDAPRPRATLPDPMPAPASVGRIVLAAETAAAPVVRRPGKRADLHFLAAKIEDAEVTAETDAERAACIELARAYASRGTDLDAATRLARRALAIGDDPGLRVELAGWLAGLGEPSLAAATLRKLVETQEPEVGAKTLVRIAVLLARAEDAAGALDALTEADELAPQQSISSELIGTLSQWAGEEVPAETAAEAYIKAATRRADAGEKDAAFEDRLRAVEACPWMPAATKALMEALTASGRGTVNDEVLRAFAEANRERSADACRKIHRRRFTSAMKSGEHECALGAAIDGGLLVDFDAPESARVEELLAVLGLYELLALRLELRAEYQSDPSLNDSVAQLYSGPLAKPDLAVEAWILALAASTSKTGHNSLTERAAHNALVERAERAGDPSALIEAYIRVGLRVGGNPTPDPADRAAVMALAQLAEAELGDPALAHWAFSQLKATEDENIGAALERLTPGVTRHREAIGDAQRAFDAASDPAGRIEALRRICDLLSSEPDQGSKALEMLSALVRAAPKDRKPALALSRLIERPTASKGLTRAELELYESVCLGRLEGDLPQSEAIETRLRLVRLARRRGDLPGALDHCASLLSQFAENRIAAATTIMVGTLAEAPRVVARALSALSVSASAKLRAVLYAVSSEIMASAKRGEDAVEYAERAVESDPKCLRAIAALADANVARTDRVMAAALERAIADILPRATWCQRLASTLEAQGEHGLSLAWTQRWLALRPGDPTALEELIRRAIAARDSTKLNDALLWGLAQPEPLGRLASRFGDALSALFDLDPKRAIAICRRALDVFGPRIPALRDRMLELADRAEQGSLAIAVLERWIAADPDVSPELLVDLSTRRKSAGDGDGAARELMRALDLGLSPKAALAALLDLDQAVSAGLVMTSDGRIWLAEGRATALSQMDPQTHGPSWADEAAAAWRQLGGLRWDLAENYGAAEQAFFAAAECSPTNGVPIYVRDLKQFAGAHDALEAVVERASMLGDVPDAMRAGLLIEAAQLAGDLGDHSRALEVAVQAIYIDPSRSDAVALVEQSAHIEGGTVALDRAYNALAQGALGSYGRRAAHYRAARQLEKRDALHLALSHAVHAFEAVPGEGMLYVLMARLAQRTGDVAPAIEALERVASDCSPEDRGEWLRRAASLRGGTEEGVRGQLEVLLRAFSLRPEAVTATDIAEAMSELRKHEGGTVATVLELSKKIEVGLSRLDGPEGCRAALVIAEAAVRHLNASELSLDALSAAVRAEPSSDQFDTMVPFVDELAEGASIGVLLERISALSEGDGKRAGPALLRLGAAIGERLRQPQVASALRARLEASLTETATAPALAGSLVSSAPPSVLSAAEEEDQSFASLRDDEAAAEPDGEPMPLGSSSRTTLRPVAPIDPAAFGPDGLSSERALAPLAQVSVSAPPPERRRDSDGLPSLRGRIPTPLQVARVPSTPPSSMETLESLEQDAQSRGDHDAVAGLLGKRIKLVDGETRRLLRLRRAAVLEQRLGRLDEAAAELRALVDEFPDDRSALPYLADLFERLETPSDAGPIWRRMSEIATDDEERADYGTRATRSYLAAGDYENAQDTFDAIRDSAAPREVLKLRVELARVGLDRIELSDALDAMAELEPDAEKKAELLAVASKEAELGGDRTLALSRARRAMELAPQSPMVVLSACRLEYLVAGTGTPREAQAVVDQLHEIVPELTEEHKELHAFLLAEALDVIQGGGAGMRELTQRHAEIGPMPLVALGMAERLMRTKHFEAALPLFQVALDADLRGLRSRSRLVLSAAECAGNAGEVEMAAALFEEAEQQPETRRMAQRRQLELTASRGAPAAAREALEQLAGSAEGVPKARLLAQLGRLLTSSDPEEAERVLTQAVEFAKADRNLRARLTEELEELTERLKQSREPASAPSNMPAQADMPAKDGADDESHSSRVSESAALSAPPPLRRPRRAQGALSSSAPPISAAGVSPLASSEHPELRSRAGGQVATSSPSSSAAAKPAVHPLSSTLSSSSGPSARDRPVSVPVIPPTPQVPVMPGSRPHPSPVESAPPSPEPVEATPLSRQPIEPSSPPPVPADDPIAQPIASPPNRAESFEPSNLSEPGGTEFEEEEPVTAIPSSNPPAQPASLPLPPLSRPMVIHDEEGDLLEALVDGSVEAGDELIELYLSDSSPRAADLLTVRRRQVDLCPGDLKRLRQLRDAAKADHIPAYARAVDHVIRGFDAASGPVTPPPLASQMESSDLVRSLLFRSVVGPVNEALGIACRSGLFRGDPNAYGLSGVERVTGSASLLGEAVQTIGRVLGNHAPVFHRRDTGPTTTTVALLSPPSLIVSGTVHEVDAELLWRLGAGLVGALAEHALVHALDASTLQRLLSAMLAAYGPVEQAPASLASSPDGTNGTSAAEIARIGGELWNLVSPASDRRLREICADVDSMTLALASQGTARAMRRAALYACGDVATSIKMVCKELGKVPATPLHEPEGLALLCADLPEVADLVRLATRMEYAELRWQPSTTSSHSSAGYRLKLGDRR